MRMGRIGDGDVHAAFVEFRAKESDKVCSSPILTHFLHHNSLTLSFTNIITYTKCLSAQCIYCQSVRAKNTSRQRQHLLECPAYLSAMKEHNPENPILHESINGPTPVTTPAKPPKKRDHETMLSGFQGDSSASRSFPIPKPVLERDFQMSIQLGPRIPVGPGIWGQRNWIGYVSGHWNGRWGKGTIVVSSPSLTLIYYHIADWLHSL